MSVILVKISKEEKRSRKKIQQTCDGLKLEQQHPHG